MQLLSPLLLPSTAPSSCSFTAKFFERPISTYCPPFLSPNSFLKPLHSGIQQLFTHRTLPSQKHFIPLASSTLSHGFSPYFAYCYFGALLRIGMGSNVPSQSPLLVLFPLHYCIRWNAPELSLSTVLFSLTAAYFWQPHLVSQFKWLLNLHLKPSPHFWTCISNCLLSISILLSDRHLEVKSLKGELLLIFLKSTHPIIVPVSITGNTIFPTV